MDDGVSIGGLVFLRIVDVNMPTKYRSITKLCIPTEKLYSLVWNILTIQHSISLASFSTRSLSLTLDLYLSLAFVLSFVPFYMHTNHLFGCCCCFSPPLSIQLKSIKSNHKKPMHFILFASNEAKHANLIISAIRDHNFFKRFIIKGWLRRWFCCCCCCWFAFEFCMLCCYWCCGCCFSIGWFVPALQIPKHFRPYLANNKISIYNYD